MSTLYNDDAIDIRHGLACWKTFSYPKPGYESFRQCKFMRDTLVFSWQRRS